MATTNIQDVLAYISNLDVDSLKKDADAAEVLTLLNAARRFVKKIESPFQRVHDVTSLSTQMSFCLLILEDLGVWESWLKAGGREASLREVWERCPTPCDIALLRRFMAMMAANDVLEEAGENRWRPTALSLALGDKDSTAHNALKWWQKVSDPSCRNLPKFLARTNYQNPLDPKICNFMDVTGPERLDCWQLFAQDPELRRNFAGYMKGQLEFRLDWTLVYDISEILNGFDKNGPNKLLVDVGGCHGHDLEMVFARVPDLPAGCLVLQDLPNVLADASKISDKIVKMPYDFFEPQPVVGSRAYLLHWVLHDWNDKDAARILKNVSAAMKKGYSKLLVCDYSMPPMGATRAQTSSDFAMMHLLSSADRTESSWLAILEGAGFEILKIWKHPVSGDSVFEAVLAE